MLERHGFVHAPAISSLRRSAGRFRFRLHPYRNHRLALLGARLDNPRAPPPQPVPDPVDREGRRRNELRDRDRGIFGAGGDPGAGHHRARLPLHATSHRRMGGELHRGRRRRARRPIGRGAGAAQDGGGRSAGAAGGRGGSQAPGRAVRGPQRGGLAGARRLSPRHARPIGAHRHRGGAARGQPRAQRHGDAHARRCAGGGTAPVAGRAFPQGTADQLLCREAGDDRRPAQRPRQARDRRDGGPSDPPARVNRSQAPAGVHQSADPRDFLRSGVFRSFALHPIFPQADRHDAAGLS